MPGRPAKGRGGKKGKDKPPSDPPSAQNEDEGMEVEENQLQAVVETMDTEDGQPAVAAASHIYNPAGTFLVHIQNDLCDIEPGDMCLHWARGLVPTPGTDSAAIPLGKGFTVHYPVFSDGR